MKFSSEKKKENAIEAVRKILSKFNIGDALYIVTKLKLETEMQMLGFDEEKIEKIVNCECECE
jgi:hypothetical protein